MKKIFIFLSNKKVQTGCQLFLGGIFLFSSLGKIAHSAAFVKAVENYKLLPSSFAHVIAYALPWIELLFGALLILNIFSRFSAIVLSGLLIIFIMAVISTLVRGINVDCGCFFQTLTKSEDFSIKKGLYVITRDIFFLIPAIVIILFQRKNIL